MEPITIQTTVNASLDKVWTSWTDPVHIVHWNFAIDTWHCPAATNDLRMGGIFSATMAAKDGSFSFEFMGTHDEIIQGKTIASTMGDGRKMKVVFEATPEGVLVTETFDPESMNPIEMQRDGWMAILENFRKYTESL